MMGGACSCPTPRASGGTIAGGFCLAAAFATDAAAAGVSVRLGLTSIPALHNKALHQNCFSAILCAELFFIRVLVSCHWPVWP